eukprot:gene1222-1543_t
MQSGGETMMEEDICRVCRNGSTPDNTLSYPCKCSGSIKFIHQNCLLEWIQHSKSSSCELCGHPFRFTPIYSENAPEQLPFHELPTLTCKVFHLFFDAQLPIGGVGQKEDNITTASSSVNTMSTSTTLSPMSSSSTNSSNVTLVNIFYDFFIGTIIQQPQQQQPLNELGPDNIEYDIDYYNNNNNQPPPQQQQQPPPLNEHQQLLQNHQGPQIPLLHQQQQPQPRVLFRIPGFFEMLGIQENQNENQNDQNNNNNENNNNENNNINNNNNNNINNNNNNNNNNNQNDQNNVDNINNLNINVINNENQMDDLDHLIGLSGPIHTMFLYFPYRMGKLIYIASSTTILKNFDSIKLGPFSEGTVYVLIGYTFLAILTLFILKIFITKKWFLKISTLLYSFIKVTIVTMWQHGTFPIIVGFCVDLSSLLLFGSSLEARMEYAITNKLPYLITRWGFGQFFIINYQYLLQTLNQIFRTGILSFYKDPNDPEYDRFKDMIKTSFKEHFIWVIISLITSILMSFLVIYLPSLFLSIIPNFLPINLYFGDPVNKGIADVLFLLATSFFPKLDARVTIKTIVKFWIEKVSKFLKLDSYLLPPPTTTNPPQPQQGVDNQNNNQNINNEQQQQQQQQIIKPNQFALRITIFSVLGWTSLFFTICVYLSLPVLMGRFVLNNVLMIKTNDIYCILLGLFLLWVTAKFIYLIFAPNNQINLIQWLLISTKIVLFGTILLLFFPLLTGFLFDLVFLVPIMAPYDESFYIHTGDMFQNWCLGALVLKFWYRWVTTNVNANNNRFNVPEDLERPRDRWVDRIEQFKRNGFMNIDVKFTLLKIIFPIGHYLLTLFTVPFCLSKGIIPMFGGSLTLENIVFRYGYPTFFFVLVFEKLVQKSKTWFSNFHNVIRDDRYLIGKNLINLDNDEIMRNNRFNLNNNNNNNENQQQHQQQQNQFNYNNDQFIYDYDDMAYQQPIYQNFDEQE